MEWEQRQTQGKGDELIKYFSNKPIELYDDKKYRIGGQEFIIPSFDNIELKNVLTFDNIKLYQYKIAKTSHNRSVNASPYFSGRKITSFTAGTLCEMAANHL